MFIQRESIELYFKKRYNRGVNKKFIRFVAYGGREELFMKIQNISNVEKFFQVVDSCAGKVELVTGEGDRLNLKSKLCQYVSMAKIFSDGTIDELEIIAYEPEDIKKLVNFMMEN